MALIHKNFLKVFLPVLLLTTTLIAQTGSVTRNFQVEAGGKLDVNLNIGDIKIFVWDKNEVSVTYKEDRSGGGITLSQSGNTIRIRSSAPGAVDKIEVKVPSVINLDLKTFAGNLTMEGSIRGSFNGSTSGGNIRIGNVIGEVTIRTSGGNIQVSDISGHVKINSMGGEIKGGNISGTGSVSTAGGNIVFKDISKDVKINTAGGNVNLGDIGGATVVSTGGGNVFLGKTKGFVTVNTGGGNITVITAGSGVKSTTGGGNVSVSGVSSFCKISSGAGNIDVEIISELTEDGSIRTGAGDVTLIVNENIKLTIEAVIKGSGWWKDEKDFAKDINSEFKASSTWNRKNEIGAIYEINGGGKVLRVRSDFGKIRIKKKGS